MHHTVHTRAERTGEQGAPRPGAVFPPTDTRPQQSNTLTTPHVTQLQRPRASPTLTPRRCPEHYPPFLSGCSLPLPRNCFGFPPPHTRHSSGRTGMLPTSTSQAPLERGGSHAVVASAIPAQCRDTRGQGQRGHNAAWQRHRTNRMRGRCAPPCLQLLRHGGLRKPHTTSSVCPWRNGPSTGRQRAGKLHRCR